MLTRSRASLEAIGYSAGKGVADLVSKVDPVLGIACRNVSEGADASHYGLVSGYRGPASPGEVKVESASTCSPSVFVMLWWDVKV